MSYAHKPADFQNNTPYSNGSGRADMHIQFDADVRKVICFLVAFRKKRAAVFPDGYFADPAWEIMLDLADAEANNHSLCVTQLGLETGCPTATIIRHVNGLAHDGYIIRTKDSNDRRITRVTLTEIGRRLLADCMRLGDQ